jgi:toxin FitB
VIVLDTNVVSELMRRAPEPAVLRWLRDQQGERLATTAVTVAEIRYGVARLPAGRRRRELEDIANDVFAEFADQILPFDAAAAAEYAAVVTRRASGGAPIDGFDAQIASVCRARGAPLATRNGKDFRDTGIDVVDPWTS